MTTTSYTNTDYRSVADHETYDLLQDFSGNDNIIEYYIQGIAENYYPADVNNILDFSSEEKKYIRFAMGDFSRLTGAQLVETNDFDSAIINLVKVDGYTGESTKDFVGLCSEEDGWFDVSWMNSGGDKMTDYEKWTLWHEVGHATGLLHPNNDDSHSDQAFTSDISVMSDNETNSYPTSLRELDIQAMRNVWGQTGTPAFIKGKDPTLPTLSTIESEGNTELLKDSSGNAYVRQDGYENLLTLRDFDGVQYKIDGTTYEAAGEWEILAAESIDGIDQVLWGYFGGQSTPSEYHVYENDLFGEPDTDWYLYETGESDIYEIGTPGFDQIATSFGIAAPSALTPTPTPTPDLTPTPETSSNIDVPVNKKWSKHLWKKSGKDGIIDYYADKKGKLDKKQNTKIAKKTLSFIDDMLDETESILGLDFNIVKKSNQADIIFQAKSKSKDVSTYKTKYGMEVSFYKTQKKPTQHDMQDINFLTGYALGLEDLKGNSYDTTDSVMAANYSDEYLGWTNNDINSLQSIW